MTNNFDKNKEYLYHQVPNESVRQTVERNYYKYVAPQTTSKPNIVTQIKQLIPTSEGTFYKVWNEAEKLHNQPLYDKYKHAVVSCVGAQDGLDGIAISGAMGIGKEIVDISRKFPKQWSGKQDYGGYLEILKDSLKDLIADGRGIYSGYNNRYGNCYEMMKQYYDPNKK